MDENIDKLKSLAQRCLQSVPVVIVGSGYSAAYGLPTVGQLSDYLKNTIQTDTQEEKMQWDRFVQLSQTLNLEQALQEIGNLNRDLLAKIINRSWHCIIEADYTAKLSLVLNPRAHALSRLLEFLFLSSNNSISVVTTNYDLLCEYAVSAFGAIHATGFLPGLIANREDVSKIEYYRGTYRARRVNIWKVHGSLDWFGVGSSIINTSVGKSLPDGFVPQIITPGVDKYQLALKEPFRTVLSEADHAMSRASSFLCIGYGFNDEHIQAKLVDRVTRQAKPICILSKELTPATKAFLSNLDATEFIAIEEAQGSNASIVYTNNLKDGFHLVDVDAWSLAGFMKWALGR